MFDVVRAATRLLSEVGACVTPGAVRLVPLGSAHGSGRGRLEAPCGNYFVKWGPPAAAEALSGEVEGLRFLTRQGACTVPAVFAAGLVRNDAERDTGRIETGAPADGDAGAGTDGVVSGYVFITEWIDTGGDREAAARRLGACLAALHRKTEAEGRYGFFCPTPIGGLMQANDWDGDWVRFYGERRLFALALAAARRGLMPSARRRRMERLLARLGDFLPSNPPASPLHGDLWGGNWIVRRDGTPVLIDPAVSFGDREMDLAMSALFGGFPRAFYDAYQAAYPLSADADERRPLYQLYYLLVHLVLFGEAYGPDVDRILARYAEGRRARRRRLPQEPI